MLALNSVQLANIDVPDAAGQGLDFDQVVFSVIPSMVAGHVGRHDPAQKNHYAWAFLARHHSDFDLVYSTTRISAENSGRGGRLWALPPAAGRVLGGRKLVAPTRAERLRGHLALRRPSRAAQPTFALPRGSDSNGIERGLRRPRGRVQPPPRLRQARRRLAPRTLGAGDHADDRQRQALGQRQIPVQRQPFGQRCRAVPLGGEPGRSRADVPLSLVDRRRSHPALQTDDRAHHRGVVLLRGPLRRSPARPRPDRGERRDDRPHLHGRRQERLQLRGRPGAWPGPALRAVRRRRPQPILLPASARHLRRLGPHRGDRGLHLRSRRAEVGPGPRATVGAATNCRR